MSENYFVTKKDPNKRLIHKADKINGKGQMSALCFDPPRAISRNARAVFAPENDGEINCPKCLKIMEKK